MGLKASNSVNIISNPAPIELHEWNLGLCQIKIFREVLAIDLISTCQFRSADIASNNQKNQHVLFAELLIISEFVLSVVLSGVGGYLPYSLQIKKYLLCIKKVMLSDIGKEHNTVIPWNWNPNIYGNILETIMFTN